MGNNEVTEIAKIFGEVLRAVRTERGITQEELAFNAQVDRTFIYRLERGLRQPSISTVIRLAKALNISANELVSKTEEKYATSILTTRA